MTRFGGRIRVLLCDADDNLFGSETPAFDASADVTNRFLAAVGIPRTFQAEELRLAATGKNFRATAAELAAAAGVHVEPEVLDEWVAEEKRVVTAHLAATLRPDPTVNEPLARLGRAYRLAAVSSSAQSRLAACFTATGLDELIPSALRFSAEDSLPVPTSKPDPAIYVHAGERLGLRPEEGLAIEDAVAGVRSAVGAGFATVGNLAFVRAEEREQRREDLLAAGASAVVNSWAELEELLAPAGEPVVSDQLG